ncbi:MAG: SUF system NifU family Fe-S cluster assembly protein [Nitrososphaerota archaeon]
MREIYSEIILDYWKNPKNKGKMENADVVISEANPLCGDTITLYFKFDGETIEDLKFEGSGCVISQSTASMLTEVAKGKNIYDILKLERKNLEKMLHVNLAPNRLKCALLPLKALKLGIYSYMGKKYKN